MEKLLFLKLKITKQTKMDEKEISNKCKEIHNQLKTQFTNN